METTKERFDRLILDACVIYGNCGSGDLHVRDLLPKDGTLTADEFATLMLEAEKMSKSRYGKQYEKNFAWCAARFRSTLQTDKIDAKEIW